MLATAGPPPAAFENFAVEAKYDGQRGLAIVEAGTARLLSRNGADITHTFPEIAAALPSALPHRQIVLDGEIVALGPDGAPSFSCLQQRWPQNRRPTPALLRRCPVQFFVFDVLAVDGKTLMHLPFVDRRAILDQLRETSRDSRIRITSSWQSCDPAIVLAVAAEGNLEGIVNKRLDSPYMPSTRSRDWIKTPLRRRSEFVVCGWLPGRGVNRHSVGAVVVGGCDSDGRLTYCGAVSAGLSARIRRQLIDALAPLTRDRCPFVDDAPDVLGPGVHWVDPVLVADVEYREFRGGLRHASWKGLRADGFHAEAVILPAC
ncbi:non-homologous end-joining DNA ligase [Mycobacterium sp. 236(2023)]|uniref:non-homologous end-joining DNA ligase n=1 Tax=Mycobacterium sp. 236(2023) TaxID=3038163 RepID=UPI0024151A08|nr:non-homologous end-joining DNA ligase [Mycobacterium sp. 236(2023)]MDG4668013.1 non-homologous end-joining DNA ligase [Mycobacterium sp. 236(2023)]